jgi:hypothetical protein
VTGYCPDHDPILAGPFRCGCGAEAYPVDAEWIGGALVLATFEQVCRCAWSGRWTAVVTVGEDGSMFPPPRGNALRAWRYYQGRNMHQCAATAKTTGRRCAKTVKEPGGLCRVHRLAGQEAA